MGGDTHTNCLRTISTRLGVEVHPTYSGNVKLGIKEILNGLLLRNHEAFGGVVLAYWNVVIKGKKAPILRGLSPYIHVNLTAKMLVFSPKVGSMLVGRVIQIGNDFLGLLVMGVFNASIRAQNAYRRFNSSSYAYGSNSPWICVDDSDHKIEVGSDILFQVHKIQSKDDFIDLEGSLNFPSSGLVNMTSLNSKSETQTPYSKSLDETPVSVRKKSKKNNFESVEAVEKEPKGSITESETELQRGKKRKIKDEKLEKDDDQPQKSKEKKKKDAKEKREEKNSEGENLQLEKLAVAEDSNSKELGREKKVKKLKTEKVRLPNNERASSSGKQSGKDTILENGHINESLPNPNPELSQTLGQHTDQDGEKPKSKKKKKSHVKDEKENVGHEIPGERDAVLKNKSTSAVKKKGKAEAESKKMKRSSV